MNVLFVHQSFPSQYRHLVRALLRQGGHTLVAMGCSTPPKGSIPAGLHYVQHQPTRPTNPETHPWAPEFEAKLIRGESCTAAAEQLRQQGFQPDLICAHPGWGESLFLRNIWPQAPQLLYQEFWYQSSGSDADFDPEFVVQFGWRDAARLEAKNAHLHLAWHAATWNVTPTQFQRSTFPRIYQDRISVIHDGIDCDYIDQSASLRSEDLVLPGGLRLEPGQPLVTFVNRTLEPQRGCHTFLRSLPAVMAAIPNAQIVVVGDTQGVSYGAPAPGNSWKEVFLAEVEDSIDSQRLHFVGRLAYEQLIHLFYLSQAHVYLTYPFVLSWSCLEAMACGAPLVGSATAPVQEVITDRETGLLVDFFSPQQLADAVIELLQAPLLRSTLGTNASSFIHQHYHLKRCVSRQLQLMGLVASGALGSPP